MRVLSSWHSMAKNKKKRLYLLSHQTEGHCAAFFSVSLSHLFKFCPDSNLRISFTYSGKHICGSSIQSRTEWEKSGVSGDEGRLTCTTGCEPHILKKNKKTKSTNVVKSRWCIFSNQLLCCTTLLPEPSCGAFDLVAPDLTTRPLTDKQRDTMKTVSHRHESPPWPQLCYRSADTLAKENKSFATSFCLSSFLLSRSITGEEPCVQRGCCVVKWRHPSRKWVTANFDGFTVSASDDGMNHWEWFASAATLLLCCFISSVMHFTALPLTSSLQLH